MEDILEKINYSTITLDQWEKIWPLARPFFMTHTRPNGNGGSSVKMQRIIDANTYKDVKGKKYEFETDKIIETL